MRPSLPYLFHLSTSESIALWKSKLLFLAMGISVTAIVLFRDGNHKVLAQDQKVSPATRSLAQRPTSRSQRVVWVNPQTGNDAKADGSEQAPFRTLTHALQTAQANTVIQLAAGTYSTDTGEVFPIVLKSGVTVQGNPNELGQGIVIRGGGSYANSTAGRQNATLIGVSQATLAGVTVTNPTVRGHGLWVETGSLSIRDNTFINSTNVGVVVTGSSTPLVQNNLFVLNRSGGMIVAGYAQPEIRENIFQRTGSGLTVSENAAPQISSNRISQNRDGIVIEGNAHPILRGNTVEDSERDGLVAIAQAQPNLGTAREPGNNRFFNNRQHDINALATDQTLPAFGNQFADKRLTGKIDLTGSAPLTSLTTVASVADRLPATRVVQSIAAQSPRPAPTSASTQPTLISSLPPSSLMPAGSAPPVLTSSLATAARPSGSTRQSAIQIPVPAPDRPQSTGGSIRPIAQPMVQPKVQSTAVEISVPPPERSSRPNEAPALRLVNNRVQSAPVQPVSVAVIRSVTSAARVVNIAVPPPAQPSAASSPEAMPPVANVTVAAAASLPRQVATTEAPTLGGAPITIPVPPPEQGTSSSGQTITASNSDTRILPVPAEEIPLGNTGDMPRVSISDSGGVLLAQRENLQYRVVVEAADEQAQSLVQSLVPDAFATTIKGRSVMQIGAFSSRDNAQEAVDLLSQSGLQGIIQPME